MKWTAEEVAERVYHEGLDYTILHYLNVEDIIPQDLRQVGIKAKNALKEFEALLPEILEE